MKTLLILLVLTVPVMGGVAEDSLYNHTTLLHSISEIIDTCKYYPAFTPKYEIVKEIYNKPEPDSVIVKMDYTTWKKFLEWIQPQSMSVTIWNVVADTVYWDTLQNW
ncbi:hypothetical protein C4561_01520 [candidate division WWE3 bacterium]|uniref:Uncharacterized protein n=1 Tax=candidate division WWE3 bacterium TaxID=2053526 RepID=A0A3A4ZFD2_UNCKA|nr:MAG: hypothetical protein C4561_01520 [candidate division WWE3 bacterium]